jgi:topoisomerase-4 subunit A
MGQVPKVISLREVLSEWLEHRIEVLSAKISRSGWRIERRLEVLDGS